MLICAKDQQVVQFVTFNEVLESISCFVINGDNRFDPYRVHHFKLILNTFTKKEFVNEHLNAVFLALVRNAG